MFTAGHSARLQVPEFQRFPVAPDLPDFHNPAMAESDCGAYVRLRIAEWSIGATLDKSAVEDAVIDELPPFLVILGLIAENLGVRRKVPVACSYAAGTAPTVSIGEVFRIERRVVGTP